MAAYAIGTRAGLTLIAVARGLFGLVFVAIGVALTRSTRRFLRVAERTRGTVVSLRLRVGSSISSGPSAPPPTTPPTAGDAGGSRQSRAYVPTVTFTTRQGEELTAESRIGSNPPAGRVGHEVGVLYDPADPSEFRIDSFLGRGKIGGPAFMFIGGGIALIAVLLAVIAAAIGPLPSGRR